jgi:anti-sigma28 factor (negative regulator of flagellin synthesis)
VKIHDSQLSGLTGLGVGGADRTRGAEGVTPSGPSRTEQKTPDGDRVQLSLLSNVLRLESEDTPERLAKVQELRDAYRSGTYRGDAEVVSKRLIDEALGGF